MSKPLGYEDLQHPTFICKLNKAIYGLKQAPRAWNITLKYALLAWGFSNSRSNTSLFIYRQGTTIILLLIYVDDVIVTGNDTGLINCLVAALDTKFALKDLGILSYFLGVQVTHMSTGMLLTQSKYIDDILHRLNMQGLKSTPSPTVLGKHLFISDGEPMIDPFLTEAVSVRFNISQLLDQILLILLII